MAAIDKQAKFIPASGLDQRWNGEFGFADNIINARVDPQGLGWLFDRGLEQWWDMGSSISVTASAAALTGLFGSTIDSVYVWSKQNTEQTYYLFEQGGALGYHCGNKNAGSYQSDKVEIAALGDRHIPNTNEPGTQYVPFGNRLLIINGYDKPVWFYGREKYRDFSFTLPTASVEILPIQSSYLSGSVLDEGIASPAFSLNETYGAGQSASRNHFDYKMTFITDTGSESPLSSPTSIDWFPGTDPLELVKFGIMLSDLPRGPDGTVARRLYRTKNQKTSLVEGASDQVYYFLKEIKDNTTEVFIDIIPDGNLVDLAPSQNDSVTISSAYQYGTSWNNRLWLAGGTPHPTRIIYSDVGLPEQFGAFSYFELGNTTGGAITAVFPYYNNLLVFRQRSIDIIRMSNGSFTVSQLTPEVGTVASNTIKFVVGIGVCFLGSDGIYTVLGGLDGGSSISVDKISTTCSKEIERINFSAAARACAAYSHKEKEYWIHYPVDGDNYNTIGLVLHTLNGQFSTRRALNRANRDLFKFASMAVDPSGYFILGIKSRWIDGANTTGPAFPNAVAMLPSVLHVWSGANYFGKQITTVTNNGTTAAYTLVKNSKPIPMWESNWIDFDDNNKKHRIFSVEVELLSYGHMNLALHWASDYNYSFDSAGTQIMAKPETVNTTSEDAIIGPTGLGSKNLFTVGEALQDGRITTLRWDVNTQLVQNFKFRLLTEGQPFHIISFHIHYGDTSIKTLNQNARPANWTA